MARVTELTLSEAPVSLTALNEALTCCPGLALILAPGAEKRVTACTGVGDAVGRGPRR